MAAIRQDRWMASLSSLSERDLATMLYLSLMELAYRHRSTPQEIAQRAIGMPEPWTLSIDAQSGAEKVTLTVAGEIWQGATGRRSHAPKSMLSKRWRAQSSASS